MTSKAGWFTSWAAKARLLKLLKQRKGLDGVDADALPRKGPRREKCTDMRQGAAYYPQGVAGSFVVCIFWLWQRPLPALSYENRLRQANFLAQFAA